MSQNTFGCKGRNPTHWLQEGGNSLTKLGSARKRALLRLRIYMVVFNLSFSLHTSTLFVSALLCSRLTLSAEQAQSEEISLSFSISQYQPKKRLWSCLDYTPTPEPVTNCQIDRVCTHPGAGQGGLILRGLTTPMKTHKMGDREAPQRNSDARQINTTCPLDFMWFPIPSPRGPKEIKGRTGESGAWCREQHLHQPSLKHGK